MSATTPEGRVKTRFRLMIANCPVPVYLFAPMQNGMGQPSLDFIGCVAGKFFAVETKAGHGDMTPRQRHTENQMAAAGAQVFLLNESETGWRDFSDWLSRTAAIEALERPEIPRHVETIPDWIVKLMENHENGSRS